MSKNTKNKIEDAAITVLVSIVEEIKENYNLSDTEVIDFFEQKGTSYLMNDTNLLFSLMHDETNTAIDIFTGRTRL